MACASPANSTVSLTDCRECGRLCVRATILPCGHVYCRRCVVRLVQTSNLCPVCGQTVAAQTGATITQRVQAMSQELVVQDLVMQRLASQGQRPCDVCFNRDATTLCQDCGEQYCDTCSAAHSKMGMAIDHQVKTLPAVLHNDPAGAQAHTATADPGPVRRQHLTQSIRNVQLPVAATGQDEGGQDWPAAQGRLLRQAVGQTRSAARLFEQVVDMALTVAQEAKDKVQEAKRKEQSLLLYIDRLDHAHGTTGRDSSSYVSGLSKDDVRAEANRRDFERRLNAVRKTSRRFDGVDRLESDLKKMTAIVGKTVRHGE